jgi:hypothetical protein
MHYFVFEDLQIGRNLGRYEYSLTL